MLPQIQRVVRRRSRAGRRENAGPISPCSEGTHDLCHLLLSPGAGTGGHAARSGWSWDFSKGVQRWDIVVQTAGVAVVEGHLSHFPARGFLGVCQHGDTHMAEFPTVTVIKGPVLWYRAPLCLCAIIPTSHPGSCIGNPSPPTAAAASIP